MASPTPSIPSLFISYSSEDREIARRLRDALGAAGLDVWYDENELGGGDAWDQKIRRQIRECTYFMPLISASTERRREGYFRREWRLAAERTLDMADDVMFLLPVVIDNTSEANARVPEKFTSVQWLRVPGGHPTPALDALVQRLLGHEPAEPIPSATPPPLPPTRAKVKGAKNKVPSEAGGAEQPNLPPPMPPFPHSDHGHRVRFVAEVVWWVITAAWMLFLRLPKWVRVVLTMWFVFMLLGTCSNSDRSDDKPRPKAAASVQKTKKEDPAETPEQQAASTKLALHEAAQELSNASKDQTGLASNLTRIGATVARRIADGIEVPESARALGVVPFFDTSGDTASAEQTDELFKEIYGELARRAPDRQSLITTAGEEPPVTDATLLARARASKFKNILVGGVSRQDGQRHLLLRQLTVADGSVAWTQTYPLDGRDTAATSLRVAADLLTATAVPEAAHSPTTPPTP